MKIFVNKDIKHFFLAIMVVLVNFLVLTEVLIWVLYEKFSFWLLFLHILYCCYLLHNKRPQPCKFHLVIVSFLIDNVCNFDGLFFVFSQTKQNVGGCSVTD